MSGPNRISKVTREFLRQQRSLRGLYIVNEIIQTIDSLQKSYVGRDVRHLLSGCISLSLFTGARIQIILISYSNTDEETAAGPSIRRRRWWSDSPWISVYVNHMVEGRAAATQAALQSSFWASFIIVPIG